MGDRSQIPGTDGSRSDDIQVRGPIRTNHTFKESNRKREGSVLTLARAARCGTCLDQELEAGACPFDTTAS